MCRQWPSLDVHIIVIEYSMGPERTNRGHTSTNTAHRDLRTPTSDVYNQIPGHRIAHRTSHITYRTQHSRSKVPVLTAPCTPTAANAYQDPIGVIFKWHTQQGLCDCLRTGARGTVGELKAGFIFVSNIQSTNWTRRGWRQRT